MRPLFLKSIPLNDIYFSMMKKPAAVLLYACLILLASAALLSCDPVNRFAEYEGLNLIGDFPFGSGADSDSGWFASYSWDNTNQTTETAGNNFVTFEPLSGPDLISAQAAAGYTELPEGPGGGAPAIYRLEVKNQFANGDFQQSSTGFLGSDDANIGPNAASWFDSYDDDNANYSILDAGGGDLRLNFVDLDDTDGDTELERVFVDLSANVSSWADPLVNSYVFHMDFLFRSENPLVFQFDDGDAIGFAGGGTADANPAPYAFDLPGIRDNQAVFFPGDLPEEKGNFMQADAAYRRLYLGDTLGTQRFIAELDNIRFLAAEADYSVKLLIPFAAEGRPDLAGGGTYTFSLFILQDPSAAATANRFASEAVNIGIRNIQSDSLANRSYSANFSTTDASGGWTEITIDAPNLLSTMPADPREAVIELSISASALGTGPYSPSQGDSVYLLDAGSILVASPSLTYTPDIEDQ